MSILLHISASPRGERSESLAGIDDVRSIAFQPNLATTDPEPGRRAAHAQATEEAHAFLLPARSALLAG